MNEFIIKKPSLFISRYPGAYPHIHFTQIYIYRKINCIRKVVFKYLISDYMQHCVSWSILINTLIAIIRLLTVWNLKILHALSGAKHSNVVYYTHTCAPTYIEIWRLLLLLRSQLFGRVSGILALDEKLHFHIPNQWTVLRQPPMQALGFYNFIRSGFQPMTHRLAVMYFTHLPATKRIHSLNIWRVQSKIVRRCRSNLQRFVRFPALVCSLRPTQRMQKIQVQKIKY